MVQHADIDHTGLTGVGGGGPHNTDHQNGGGDEVSVAGLSGLLADGQTPLAHKTSHQDGGSDEISLTGLAGESVTPQPPKTHAASHDGGADDLNGSLTPAGHAASHENGGSDEIDVTGLVGAGGGGGGGPVYDIERRTAGDLSVTSTSAGTAIPTLGTLIVPAASGDLLHIGLDANLSADNDPVRMDVASIVSAAVVNYVSSLTGTPATVGISGWGGAASASIDYRIGHVIPYVVQAGDVSGGNIELSLRSWLAAGTARAIQASTGSPLVFWVQNFGQ